MIRLNNNLDDLWLQLYRTLLSMDAAAPPDLLLRVEEELGAYPALERSFEEAREEDFLAICEEAELAALRHFQIPRLQQAQQKLRRLRSLVLGQQVEEHLSPQERARLVLAIKLRLAHLGDAAPPEMVQRLANLTSQTQKPLPEFRTAPVSTSRRSLQAQKLLQRLDFKVPEEESLRRHLLVYRLRQNLVAATSESEGVELGEWCEEEGKQQVELRGEQHQLDKRGREELSPQDRARLVLSLRIRLARMGDSAPPEMVLRLAQMTGKHPQTPAQVQATPRSTSKLSLQAHKMLRCLNFWVPEDASLRRELLVHNLHQKLVAATLELDTEDLNQDEVLKNEHFVREGEELEEGKTGHEQRQEKEAEAKDERQQEPPEQRKVIKSEQEQVAEEGDQGGENSLDEKHDKQEDEEQRTAEVSGNEQGKEQTEEEQDRGTNEMDTETKEEESAEVSALEQGDEQTEFERDDEQGQERGEGEEDNAAGQEGGETENEVSENKQEENSTQEEQREERQEGKHEAKQQNADIMWRLLCPVETRLGLWRLHPGRKAQLSLKVEKEGEQLARTKECEQTERNLCQGKAPLLISSSEAVVGDEDAGTLALERDSGDQKKKIQLAALVVGATVAGVMAYRHLDKLTSIFN